MAVDEDMTFYIRIAEASHNYRPESFILILFSDIHASFTINKVCGNDQLETPCEQHKALIKTIAEKELELAQISQDHSEGILKFGSSTQMGEVSKYILLT